MKKILGLMLVGAFLLFQAGTGWAQTTFTLSANVPLATGVGFTVYQVNAATNAFTTLPNGTTALNFGNLVYTNVGTTANPSYIFLPTNYYAIDIAVTGGAGTPDSTVNYTDGAAPTGATSTLGVKGTAMFVKETYTSATTPPTESTITGFTNKYRYKDVSALHIPYTALGGSWLRVYLGIWDGNTTQTYLDPANGQPFTAADAAGTYTGTMTFTETVN